jgi:ferredoxin--NADP+ reductase
VIRFCVSPIAILGEEAVEAIEVVHNELVADELVRISAVATGRREVIPCGLVLRSVGYRGVAIPGVPFDEGRAAIPNRAGRVVDGDGNVIPGLYCAGWIKRGPSGVIGTNKKDATETVELLLEDAEAGLLRREDTTDIAALLVDRGVAPVSDAGWQAIDAVERARGEEQGRPRVKLGTWPELLDEGRVC